MILNQSQIADAARVIVNTRDLCGDERRAFFDWAADNGLKCSDANYRQANFRANAIWRDSQKAAGVPEKYWRA